MTTQKTESAEPPITKGEREDLQRLIRQREKVLKSAAKQRSAEMLADFANAMGSEFAFDDDAVWKKATEEAEREVAKAQKAVAARCRELGIPDRFAPSLTLHWRNRGSDNIVDKRKGELRRIALTRIEAIEQKAIVEIEQACLEAQTRIAIAGLTSEAATAFVRALPSIETLMPALSYAEVAGGAEPPIIEQLVSPGALRQRRYRERHRALADNVDITPVTSQGTAVTSPAAAVTPPAAAGQLAGPKVTPTDNEAPAPATERSAEQHPHVDAPAADDGLSIPGFLKRGNKAVKTPSSPAK